MEDLKLKPLAELLYLLADETAKYVKLVHYGGCTKEDLQQIREFMTALQLEIEDRKAKSQ